MTSAPLPRRFLNAGCAIATIPMISAIIAVLNEQELLVIPNTDVPAEQLVGRKARYVDKEEKVWPGKVDHIADSMLCVKLDKWPSGLGQGQIIEIYEEGDE